MNKTLLWLTTVAVLAFAFFPNYVGALMGQSGADVQTIDKRGLTEFNIEIAGMTCEACAAHTGEQLRKLPGVRSASVSYDDKRAIVLAEKDVTETTIRREVKAAGYEVVNVRAIDH